MHSSSPKVITSFIAVIIVIALTLNGCSSRNTSQSSSSTKPTLVKSTPTMMQDSTQVPSAIALNKSASFSMASLNIQSTAVACPMDDWLYSNALSYSGGNIVVTDSNASFDVGTITHLTTSIDKNDPSLLPNKFAAVLGAFATKSYGTSCRSIWQITNTSQNVIQVNQVALVYAADAQPNTYHYKVIDLCSLPAESRFCGGQRGGGGGGPIYQFKLAPKSRGTAIYSSNNQPFSIDAGQTVPVELLLDPADLSNPDYVYSVIPEITLNTSSQPQQLPQLTSRVAFADSHIASCYQLQDNNTFVQGKNLTIPVTEEANSITAECV